MIIRKIYWFWSSIKIFKSLINNEYFHQPKKVEGKFPSPDLKKLEEKLNKIPKIYPKILKTVLILLYLLKIILIKKII